MRSLKYFICIVFICCFLKGFAQQSSPSPTLNGLPAASASPSPALDVTLPPVPPVSSALPEPSNPTEATVNPQGSLFPQSGSIQESGTAAAVQDLLQGNGKSAPIIRKSTTSTSLQSLQDKISYRTAKTKATNEPKFQQELASAQAQITEPEFRNMMRAYYKGLHDRIIELNPSCKSRADTVLADNLEHLNQSRLRSTSAEEVEVSRTHH